MALRDARIAVVGAGAMGGAIARGLVESGAVPAPQVLACDHSASKLEPLAALGAVCRQDTAELLSLGFDLAVLAVKPQVLPAVLKELEPLLAGHAVVSIAAGVALDALETALPGSRVLRAMPNLPVQTLSGATALCAGDGCTREDVGLARDAFAALGVCELMREDQLDVAGAVSGCGPAYFALIVDQLVRAGVERGLAAGACRRMVLSTMRGTACQLLGSGEHPRAYMERVTSPGGTTAAGLRAMETQTFWATSEAVEAALERNAELAGGAA
nr:pyrroline-5-carboxylate reductase [uncultured Olsenella sp.]